MRRPAFLLMLLVIGAVFSSGQAHGELRLQDGRWRLELSRVDGIYSGKESRHGDTYLTASVEYEVPAGSHGTLGLRMFPLFLYSDDEPDRIYGGAIGVTGRLYTKRDKQRGFFGEVGAAALWHNRQFEGNGSSLNFLTQVGVGYQFPIDVHVAVSFQHISNAGLSGDNAGINGVGVGMGFSF